MLKNESIGKDEFPISEAITVLRRELLKARDLGLHEEVRFPVQSMTIELQVAAVIGADGHFGFSVPLVGLAVGGSGSTARTTTHTVRIVLGPPRGEFEVSLDTSEEKE